MKNKKILLIKIFLITFLPILIIYLPFIFKLKRVLFLNIKDTGFVNIIRNWDGPHYIIVAKTFYNLKKITKMLFVSSMDPIYYTSHFPLFPILIRAIKDIFGWLYSGLIINLIFGFLLNIVFYKIAEKHSKHPLFLTLVFTIFPARFLVTRAIIAPETLLLFLILSSFYFWEKKNYFLSSLLASLSVLTKIQAIFLFPAFWGAIIERYFRRKKPFKIQFLWTLLIPLALLLLFIFYYFKTGDFFVFFRAEKGNNLFIYFPFSQFNFSNTWAGTGWLEDVAFYFVGMFILISSLYKSKNRSWFYFSLFYTLFLIVVPQRDISRFSYPLLPFFMIEFERFLTSKKFQVAFLLSLPALYFYTLNFILVNQAPIADWTHLLR